jgi:hypothetical protein
VANPWSSRDDSVTRKAPYAGGFNGLLVVELEFGGKVEYHFVEVDDVNVPFSRGATGNYTFVLTTYESRSDNRLPVISVDPDVHTVEMQEGNTFQATVRAVDPDGDPVVLVATPLWNSSFDLETGRFSFRPDSLQVNLDGSFAQNMRVTFRADDGKFASTRDVFFHVADRESFVLVGRGDPLAFLRGDANRNGTVDIADAIATLWSLFGDGTPLPCADAADSDDDGAVELDDAVFTLVSLFRKGPATPAPSWMPGRDPTPDALACDG